MEDKTTQTEANQVKQPSTEASQNNVLDGIPKSRFDEVNTQKNEYKTQNQELQAQLDKIKADQEATRQKQLEKNGEYKTLLDEANLKLEKAQVDVNAWGEYKTNKRNTLMEQLTDDSDKSIAGDLSLDKLELYVSKVNKRNTLPTNNSRAISQQKVGDFGGYDSIEEYAMNDPVGADKYLAQNVDGYKWGHRKK
jgi:DNA repair exonuclease SbcCD ATPase subunit